MMGLAFVLSAATRMIGIPLAAADEFDQGPCDSYCHNQEYVPPPESNPVCNDYWNCAFTSSMVDTCPDQLLACRVDPDCKWAMMHMEANSVGCQANALCNTFWICRLDAIITAGTGPPACISNELMELLVTGASMATIMSCGNSTSVALNTSSCDSTAMTSIQIGVNITCEGMPGDVPEPEPSAPPQAEEGPQANSIRPYSGGSGRGCSGCNSGDGGLSGLLVVWYVWVLVVWVLRGWGVQGSRRWLNANAQVHAGP